MFEVIPLHVDPSGKVTVKWEGSKSSTDWIGLYRVGAPNDAFLDWKYASSGSKSPELFRSEWSSCQFTMPGPVGQYEFRFLRNDGYDAAFVSEVVRVVA